MHLDLDLSEFDMLAYSSDLIEGLNWTGVIFRGQSKREYVSLI